MKKYHVQQNELHVAEYVVEAGSTEEAAHQVLMGNGTLVTVEYAGILESMAGAGLPPSIRHVEEVEGE